MSNVDTKNPDETEQEKASREHAEQVAHWSKCLELVGKDQDRDAFQKLYSHFSPLIKAFAFKVPALEHLDTFADELVQETMIKIWKKAGSFDPSIASPSTWIFSIARNMRIDLLRKQARHTVNTVSIEGKREDDDGFDLEDIWTLDEDNDVFNQLALQKNRLMLHESLKTLPEEQAFILRKVYMEDKSHSEVATELEMPLGTVKSRVRLALSKLRVTVDR